MSILCIILLSILAIWLISGLIGGLFYTLPNYAKSHNISKRKWEYWVVCILMGIISLKETIQVYCIEREIKKLKK